MLHARANMHGVRCAAHRALAATRTIAAVAHSRPLLRASAAPTCRSATGAATAHLHTRVTHLSPTGSGSGIDKDDADAPPSRFDDDSLSSPDELDDLLEEDAEADEDRDDDAIGEDAAEEEEDTADAEKSEETIAEVEEPRQNLKPSELVAHLDKYIVGQLAAKKSVAVALRNRWRRHSVSDTLKQDITPKNILLVGPTGCGKTEVARRLALITDSPFIKVESTKFTEVGFYGKDVDSIIKDLVRGTIAQLKAKRKAKLIKDMAGRVEEMILIALHRTRAKPPAPTTAPTGTTPAAPKPSLDWSNLSRRQASVAAKSNKAQWAADSVAYRAGELDQLEIEIPLPPKKASDMFSAGGGGSGGPASGFAMSEDDGTTSGSSRDMEGLSFRLVNLGIIGGGSRDAGEDHEARLVTVGEARASLLEHLSSSRLRPRDLAKRAIKMVESDGIVFLDEIDKICTPSSARRFSTSGDASAEGVQRDLLPLVEGTTVSTPHGPVNTDHILFICSGAFHAVAVNDMLPELQGRLPVRVELKALTEEDFYRILTVPTNNLIKQQIALLKTDNVDLSFTDAALREIAKVACEVNRTLENIGARRLNTVIQRIVDDYSFTAADQPEGTRIEIGVEYVREKIKPLIKDADLSKYVL